MSLTFGSLFTGIGGFDLGFERAGMRCAWQVEIDKDANKVLDKHFSKAERFTDVREVGKHNLRPVDVICGGFPCQDLSIAGKRKGLTGERSGLWFEFARIIDELNPQWVVIENVAGLLSSSRGRDFAVIIQWLANRGYGVAWRVLDSQYFGVAQRRRRVFIVGSFGTGRSAEVLFESEGVRWDTPARRKAGEGVAYSLRANPSHSGDKGDGGINTTLIPHTATTLAGGSAKCHSDITSGQQGGNVICIAHGQANAEMVNDGSPSLTANHEQPIVCWEMQHASEAYREAGSIAPNLQARMGTGGNNVPLVGLRRLTPTEYERLQGFPDGWTAGQSDSARYRQLGNAVTVNVVQWIGQRICLTKGVKVV